MKPNYGKQGMTPTWAPSSHLAFVRLAGCLDDTKIAPTPLIRACIPRVDRGHVFPGDTSSR